MKPLEKSVTLQKTKIYVLTLLGFVSKEAYFGDKLVEYFYREYSDIIPIRNKLKIKKILNAKNGVKCKLLVICDRQIIRGTSFIETLKHCAKITIA